MTSLIVEDDFITRRILKDILSPYGTCDVAVDGEEAVHAFRLAWEEDNPYDLICMDIMMPKMDGHEALSQIREFEKLLSIRGSMETKVIMITALSDPKNVIRALAKEGAAAYITKPINKQKLLNEITDLGLIPAVQK
ncbi:MAG: response regulator [bacterium]